jgi:hypothetical protein
MKKHSIFILIILFISTLLLSGCTSKKWTLFICETSHHTGGCMDNKYVLEGYKSQRECMEKGITLQNEAGFECGGSCKIQGYGGYVCNPICNEKRGCYN